ncbi:MAG: CPBP family intramembrane metalloprotease [Planctomycetia bacterium]|nr:CPBP family intramembrane metalloprotease [Planctomycetia bacterium]
MTRHSPTTPIVLPIQRSVLLMNTLLVEGGLAVLALFLSYWIGPDLFGDFNWNRYDIMIGCLGAVPPLVLILAMDRFPIGPFRHISDISDKFLRPLLANCKWPDYFLLAFLAGFCEELLFRGWMQLFLINWVPVWCSVLITGIIFGLCHLITPAYFIIACLISIYLSCLYIWSGNLVVPMLTHGVYDLIAIFAVMAFSPKSMLNIESESLHMPMNSTSPQQNDRELPAKEEGNESNS